MEGVGARFGRSSTRYGPTTVFTGPVRRWKKKWVHVSAGKNNHQSTVANGRVNGSNGSHLVFLKWTPITASQNNNNGSADKDGDSKSPDKDGDSKSPDKDDDVPIEEPPKRKFKYIPVALLENQNNETSDQDEDEAKPMVADANIGEPTSQADYCDEKPDINDVPMEENQDPEDKPPERQDLNENTLDLSVGFTVHEENDADSKTIQTEEDKLDKVN